jgi:cellulose synthase/poly-beta-1,6-N-acetylglucosamine synthase-like glycosyltransferase
MNAWLFWLSLGVVAYTYAGYALLVAALARKRGRTPARGDATPALTVVITAYNEGTLIAQRVRNILDQDYPPENFCVLVVDDGSDDGTARAADIGDTRVRVLTLPQRAGKAAALNAAMAQVTTPYVVFGDARQQFARDALRRLIAPFADMRVGAVAGELELGDSGHVGLYWKMERRLREGEARLGWLHGVSGAIYALRTELFRPLSPGILLDDLWIPLHVLFAGHSVWFARDAIAWDAQNASAAAEYRRKLRTLAGNWQLIARLPRLLVPWRNPVFFAWFSHKMLRLLAPWCLLALWAASFLADGALYRFAFVAQTVAYGVAALMLLAPRIGARIPLAGTAASFVMLNAAALFSLPAYLARDQFQLWKKR